MPAPKKYTDEMRDRAIRLVQDLLADPEVEISITGACTRVEQQLGVNRDTLRGWIKQVQIDEGTRPGLSTVDWGVALGLVLGRRERGSNAVSPSRR